jgi:hypothetical protein
MPNGIDLFSCKMSDTAIQRCQLVETDFPTIVNLNCGRNILYVKRVLKKE